MPQATAKRQDTRNLGFREFSVRAQSLNEEARTVDADISSENPVAMWDWERGEMIPEVLLADGMTTQRANQVPLLDSHSRWETSSLLGSARSIEVSGDRVRATLHFSAAADDQFTKVREGHLTDVSVGYQVLKRQFVAAGKTKTIRGRSFTGPVNVATSWRLLEVSVTPIGADEQAKLRQLSAATLTDEGFAMNPELRALLTSLGCPEDHDDEAAQRWLVENKDKLRAAAPPAETKKPEADKFDLVMQQLRDLADPTKMQERIDAAARKALEAQESARAKFRKDVDGLAELAGVNGDAVRELYSLSNIDEVRTKLLEQRAKASEGVEVGHAPITFGAAQRDKHYGAIETALMHRTMSTCAVMHDDDAASARREKALKSLWPEEKRSKHWEQFRYAGLLDMAKECLRMDGVDIRGLSNDDIAIAALGFFGAVGIRSDNGAAYHGTGSFPKLTQDAVNKSMMLGNMEYPSTWRGPMKQGNSVPDFKTIHRMQLGAVPNLPIWDDRKDPNRASFADAEETYAVECRSLALDFNYRVIVNDDVDFISKSPMKLGDAAARTLNAVAWAQITANGTMRDGVALFAAATGNRKRTNLTTGAGAPSVTTVQTLTNLMMQMRGENTPEGNESEDILAIAPRYIAHPSAMRTTVLQLVNSVADPASSNSNVYNPVNNNLIPVCEPLLDASSTTAWYLFAEPTRIETVEVTFLQGQEQPRVRVVNDERRLSREYIILQTFAAKALDHRGMQKHAGA